MLKCLKSTGVSGYKQNVTAFALNGIIWQKIVITIWTSASTEEKGHSESGFWQIQNVKSVDGNDVFNIPTLLDLVSQRRCFTPAAKEDPAVSVEASRFSLSDFIWSPADCLTHLLTLHQVHLASVSVMQGPVTINS